MPRITVKRPADLLPYEDRVRRVALRLTRRLSSDKRQGLRLLYALRFKKYGFHPVDSSALNCIEQLIQTFTCLVAFEAARFIFRKHKVPELHLNLAEQGGRDIQDTAKKIVSAEVFASVAPNNNKKLKRDIASVAKDAVKYKYVFFYSPSNRPGMVNTQGLSLSKKQRAVQVMALRRPPL